MQVRFSHSNAIVSCGVGLGIGNTNSAAASQCSLISINFGYTALPGSKINIPPCH